MTADEAVGCVASGMHIFVHGAAATPTPLIDALSSRPDLGGISLYHLHTCGPAPFAEAASIRASDVVGSHGCHGDYGKKPMRKA